MFLPLFTVQLPTGVALVAVPTRSSFGMCLLTRGLGNQMKGGTVMNPLSIAPLRWCPRRPQHCPAAVPDVPPVTGDTPRAAVRCLRALCWEGWCWVLGGAQATRVPIPAGCSSRLCLAKLPRVAVRHRCWEPPAGQRRAELPRCRAQPRTRALPRPEQPAGGQQNQMGQREAKSLEKTTGDLWQLGRSWRSPGMDKVSLDGAEVLLASGCGWRV